MGARATVDTGCAATKFKEQPVVKELRKYLKTLKAKNPLTPHPYVIDKLISDSEYLLEILQNLWDINEERLRSDIITDMKNLCYQFEYSENLFFHDYRCFRMLLLNPCIKKYSALSMHVEPTITVCFTPEEDVCLDKILDEIRKARLEILVQAYTFNSRRIAEALLAAAHKRGVVVKMLIDKGCSKTPLIVDLEKCGIEVQVDEQEGIAHNKVMIIDDVCIITGSYNWTVAAEKENSENVVIIRNECVASMYKYNFSYLKSKETGPSSEHHDPFPSFIKGCDGCKVPYTQDHFTLNKSYAPTDYSGKENYAVVYACFTPRWRCLDLIICEIESAETSVLVQASCLTLDKIANALTNSKRKGIDVQLLIDEGAFDKIGQQIDNMGLEGIPVTIDKISGIAHNKVIIIDDDIVMTGSYNLSKSAENRNSENVIFIKNFYVNQIFKSRWKARAECGKKCVFEDESTHR